jgi:hypothetical protein
MAGPGVIFENGFQQSAVLGRRFRLLRSPSRRASWRYRLEHRGLAS